ncbi:MAG: Bacterial regulatory protein luxR family [Pseudomonadota bacterium]|jgi:DNA-binding CsgD family transcriptional regulator
MLPLDNVTTIYLTGLIAIGFSATQLILLIKKGRSVLLWSVGSLLMGLGYIVTLTQIADPLPQAWVLGPISVLLGSLIVLSALGIWSGYTLPKKASLICLGGVGVTGALFYFSRLFNAPLGSLEAILLAPISAVLIYSAWFVGVQAKQSRSKYLYLISGVLWIQGLFMAVLTLGALAAIGDQYIVVTSQVVYWTSLVYLLSTLINNISWSLQISEDLLIAGGRVKKDASSLPISRATDIDTSPVINKSEKPIKEKKVAEKIESVESITINPDLLNETEKLALLENLTDKERDVFFLAAEGKKNGEIATILNSSEASVKVHRSRMTGKLGMKKPDDLKKLISKTESSSEGYDAPVEKVAEEVKPDLFTNP